MAAATEWTWLHYGFMVISGLFVLIGALLKLVWHIHQQKITELTHHVGKHFSEINDLRTDHTELAGRVNAHDGKFTDVVASVAVFRSETNASLLRIEAKIDKYSQQRGP